MSRFPRASDDLFKGDEVHSTDKCQDQYNRSHIGTLELPIVGLLLLKQENKTARESAAHPDHALLVHGRSPEASRG